MFGKIFRQIFNSSIAEDWQIRHVFMDLIVLADAEGVVDMTHEALSRTTNVPLDIVRRAVERLEQPDPKSRSPQHSGARLVRLDSHRDWGWQITNYQLYREFRDENQRKTYLRNYMRAYMQEVREGQKQQELLQLNEGDVKQPVKHVKPSYTNGSTSSSSSSLGTGEGGAGGRGRASSQDEVVEFCRGMQLTDSDAVYFFNKCQANGWTNGGRPIRDWKATIRSWQAAGYMPSQKAQRINQQQQPKKRYVPNI